MSPFRSASMPMASRALHTHSDLSMQRVSPALVEQIGGLPCDRDFIAMRAAYRATGGTARGDDLARMLEDRQRGDYVSLARLIVSGEIFSFQWHHTYWVPMFQFELRDLSIKPGPRQVHAELASVFDGWTLAVWFAQPNSWLNERKPVDLLDSDLADVLEAARADRFIATG
jgi:hypothetical protein